MRGFGESLAIFLLSVDEGQMEMVHLKQGSCFITSCHDGQLWATSVNCH